MSAPEPGNLAEEVAEKTAARVVAALKPFLGSKNAVGRATYTVAEIAARNSVSTRHVYSEIAAGKLTATRPGNGTLVRVTPRDETLWIQGQSLPSDEPARGISRTSSQRARTRAVIANALSQLEGEK